MGITSTFWNESTGHCDCCGRVSKKIWGDLSDAAGTQAVYFVHWTVDAPEHFPNIDLVLGQWGEGAEAVWKRLVKCSPSGARVNLALSFDRQWSQAAWPRRSKP